MKINSYLPVSISVGNFTKNMEIRENYVTSFIVERKIFTILGTDHALKRLEQRNVNKYYIASALMSLGADLIRYNDSNRKIVVNSVEHDVSCVFTIEKFSIVLITVHDTGTFRPKNYGSTVTIKLG